GGVAAAHGDRRVAGFGIGRGAVRVRLRAQAHDRASGAAQAVAEAGAGPAALLRRALEVQARAVGHLRAVQRERVGGDACEATRAQACAEAERVLAAFAARAVVAARARGS